MKKFTRTIEVRVPAVPGPAQIGQSTRNTAAALKRAAVGLADPTGLVREIVEDGPLTTAATALRYSPLMILIDPTGIWRASATDPLFVERVGRHAADMIDASLDSIERNTKMWWRESREEMDVTLNQMRELDVVGYW